MGKREELARINKKLNDQMLRAERAGLTQTKEYKEVKALAEKYGTKSKTGKVRFKERTKKIKEEDLKKMLEQSQKALTYGLGKQKKLKNKKMQEIMDKFKKADIEVSATTLNDVLELQKNETWKTLREFYSSDEIVDIVQIYGKRNISNKLDLYLAETSKREFNKQDFIDFLEE